MCATAKRSIRGDIELVAGGHHDHVGEEPHVGDVEAAMMGRAIGAGQPGAVEREDDGQILQGDLLEDLIEGTLQEGGVDVADRAGAGLGHAGGEGDRMRFADADIEEPQRVIGPHLFELVPLAHGGGDDRHPRILVHELMDGRR